MTSAPPKDVLVLVPAYNEARNVGAVVDDLRAHGYPVVVVDDGSVDATAEVAAAHGAAVLRLPMNLGVGGALRCGFRFAVEQGYQRVVQCDGDGQHLAYEIAVLLEVMDQQDRDLVVGTRFAPGQRDYAVRGSRRIAMRTLSFAATRLTGVRLTDTTSGFRAIRQPLLGVFSRDYPVQYLGDTFEALVNAGRAGFRLAEVPVRMRERASGTSSASSGAAVRYVARALLTVLIGSGKQHKRQV